MIKKTVILSVISFITLVLFHCPSFAEGLVSYWTCDSPDIVGTTVKDIAGSNHGIIQGTVPIVAGKFGEALQFGSLDSYVDCGNDASLNISSEITIEAWIKQFGIGGGNFNAGVVCKAQKGGTPWSWQLRYNFFPDGLYLGFQFNSPEGPRWVTAERGLTPGVWYHVVGTFNGSELKFYLNGAERDSNTMSGMITSDAPLLIGQDGWLNVFQGLVDEVKIYNRALSLHEIQQNYGVAPKLSVSPSEIDFGEESIQETFTISNTGGGLLLWQAAKQQTWLTISPDSGAIESEETSECRMGQWLSKPVIYSKCI